MSSMDEYLKFAKSVALEAGEIMSKHFTAGIKKDWKKDSTPVTIADTEINALVIERVKDTYPDHSVWGEEENHNLGSKMTWVCDPVDGTMPYSHGLPICAFMLALVEDGRPVVGVVYDPFMKRMFAANKGGGAFLNDEKISVSERADFKNALIDEEGITHSTKPIVAVSHDFLDDLISAGAQITQFWSVGLPSALVAAGEFTATLFNVPKPEDGAAIKVIVEEAGGKVTDLFGNEQRYDGPTKGFIASNGRVHQQLVDLLAKHRIDK